MFELSLILLKSSLLGIVRGGVSFVFEHPFDVLKTRWQADPHITSMRILAKELYSQKGWRGFYVGFIPNTCRILFKHAYRTPLLLFCTYIIITFYGSEHPIFLGVFMAMLEACIIQPMERLKVWMMTSPYSKGALRKFWHKHHFHTLYQGLSATLPRQTISWVSFLWAEHTLRTLFLSYNPFLEWGHITFISLLVGIINTVCVLPFDCIKTHMQAYQQGEGEAQTWRKTALYIYKTYRFKGFYVGWKIRLVQYSIQALWTSSMFNFFLQQIHRIAQS